MTILYRTLITFAGVIALLSSAGAGFAQELTADDIVLENLPEDVVATMEARDRWFAALPRSEDGLEFFVEDLMRWPVGATVRVAFLGGDTALHKKIADATAEIIDNCNLKLDFGVDAATGKYRTWSSSDSEHAADIRVSFDQSGYFSLVGRDSINTSIGSPSGPVGGRANQRSLNLGGFHLMLPPEWKKTVRHEFLHALAFHHEHQSPVGGCDAQFRWDDDPGYVPTQDSNGRYIEDGNNKRPGIYTYLSGFPNFWGKAKVNFNLRQASGGAGFGVGPFDRASIMLYRFPKLFYVTDPSPCAPFGGTESLSAGDIDGLKKLYPSDTAAVEVLGERQELMIKNIRESAVLNDAAKASALELIQSGTE